MTVATPVGSLPEGRHAYGLNQEQMTEATGLVLRHFAALVGRPAEPAWLQSGAAGALRYDVPRVIQGAPVGGYGPGRCSEPDLADAGEEVVADAIAALPDYQRVKLAWRYGDRLPVEAVAGRMGLGKAAAQREIRRALTGVWLATRAGR